MGFGDELMALGEAQALRSATGLPVRILDAQGGVRWSEVWMDQEAIAQPGDHPRRYAAIVNGPNARPYIDHWGKWQGQPCSVFAKDWRARDYRASYKLDAIQEVLKVSYEKQFSDYVIVEHRPKGSASPNKGWSSDGMSLVVKGLRARGVRAIHAVANFGEPAADVEEIVTDSFNHALALMAGALGYIGIEGGLHHAAAALRKPAVVIWGGFSRLESTGYPDHENVGTDGADGCGRWAPCPHCAELMGRITPGNVLAGADRAFKEAGPWAR